MESMLRFYDCKTGQVNEIREEDLAPGMVQIERVGIGTVWICDDQLTNLRKSPYRHPPFDEGILDILRGLKRALDLVHPMTLEEWEDGFRRDMNPEREIAIWMRIASAYRHCTVGRHYSIQQRIDFFNVILACSCNPTKHVLKVARFSAISKKQAAMAIRVFCAPQRDLAELDGAPVNTH